jgi:hypothetical protein
MNYIILNNPYLELEETVRQLCKEIESMAFEKYDNSNYIRFEVDIITSNSVDNFYFAELFGIKKPDEYHILLLRASDVSPIEAGRKLLLEIKYKDF